MFMLQMTQLAQAVVKVLNPEICMIARDPGLVFCGNNKSRSLRACYLVTLLSESMQEVPGFTWCPKGCESRITHLVLGSDNPDSRTEKVQSLIDATWRCDVAHRTTL